MHYRRKLTHNQKYYIKDLICCIEEQWNNRERGEKSILCEFQIDKSDILKLLRVLDKINFIK